jgi:hypothetical protein
VHDGVARELRFDPSGSMTALTLTCFDGDEGPSLLRPQTHPANQADVSRPGSASVTRVCSDAGSGRYGAAEYSVDGGYGAVGVDAELVHGGRKVHL